MQTTDEPITSEEHIKIISAPRKVRDRSNRSLDDHLRSIFNTSASPAYPEVWSTDSTKFFSVVAGNEFLAEARPFVKEIWNANATSAKLSELVISRGTHHETVRPYAFNMHDMVERVSGQDFAKFGLINQFWVEHGRFMRPIVNDVSRAVAGSVEDSNYARHRFTRGFQAVHNDFMIKFIKEMNVVDPDAVERIFGKPVFTKDSKLQLPSFNSKLMSLYVGDLDETGARNNVNPWIYFDLDHGSFDLTQFRRMIAERYSPLLQPAAIVELESALADHFASQSSDFKAMPDVQKRRAIRNEATAKHLLGVASVLRRLDDLSSGKGALAAVTRAGDDHGRSANLDRVVDAYRKFAREIGIYGGIRALESLSRVALADYANIPEKPVDNMTFMLCQGRQPFNHVKNGYVVDIDTLGYSGIAADKEANLDPFELHERQFKRVLMPLRKLGEDIGGYHVKFVGDEVYMFFEDPETALYFSYVVKTEGKDHIAKGLVAQGENRIASLERSIDALTNRSTGANEVYKQTGGYIASPVTKDMLGKEKKTIESERKRIDAVQKHDLDFRVAIGRGQVFKDSESSEYTGEGIIVANRYTAHPKDMEPLFDADEHNGALANFHGIVFSSGLVEGIEQKLQGNARFKRYDGVQFSGRSLNFVEYVTPDGKNLLLRTVSQSPIKIAKYTDTPWKVVLDEREYMDATKALGEYKKLKGLNGAKPVDSSKISLRDLGLSDL
jgi:hypothetical protein